MDNDTNKTVENEMQLPVNARKTDPATRGGAVPSVDRLSDLVCR